MERHPKYTHEPLQEDLAREHFLHRLVAGSAFLFALCILPVSQYFLVGKNTATTDNQVLGISTEAPAAYASPTTLLTCVGQKQQDEQNIDTNLASTETSLSQNHQTKLDEYNNALAQLPGVDAASTAQRISIQKLESEEVSSYNATLAQDQATADAQKQVIAARSCPAQ